jgi:hypothetical protein
MGGIYEERRCDGLRCHIKIDSAIQKITGRRAYVDSMVIT